MYFKGIRHLVMWKVCINILTSTFGVNEYNMAQGFMNMKYLLLSDTRKEMLDWSYHKLFCERHGGFWCGMYWNDVKEILVMGMFFKLCEEVYQIIKEKVLKRLVWVLKISVDHLWQSMKNCDLVALHKTSFINKLTVSLHRKFKTDSDNFSSSFSFFRLFEKKGKVEKRFEYSFSISPTDVWVGKRNWDRISKMWS